MIRGLVVNKSGKRELEKQQWLTECKGYKIYKWSQDPDKLPARKSAFILMYPE